MAARRFVMAAVLSSLAIAQAPAQQFPAKTIRLVSGFPTGPNLVIGPLLVEGLRETFKPGVVMDIRPGAGGSVAMELVAKSAPDGYTLLITSPVLTITPIVRPALKLDPLRDFTPITLVGTVPNVMVVHPSVPAGNLAEFVRVARAQPGKLTYATAGHGSTNHLMTELFSMLAKVRMTHAPYKSNTFAAIDVVRGDVDMLIAVRPSVAQFVPSGKLRIIAVLSPKRTAELPNVPTAIEQGMPELVAVSYYGVLAPGGTPSEIIDRLHREMTRVLGTSQARQALARGDLEPVLSTPAEFAAEIRKESARWSRVVREANVKLEGN